MHINKDTKKKKGKSSWKHQDQEGEREIKT